MRHTAEILGATWDRRGVSREVILFGRWAVKLPKLTYGWQLFLCGLLANMQERSLATLGWPELCPVAFSLPGGWLVVMRRASPLDDATWATFDAAGFCTRPDGTMLAVEHKQDSFGLLDGRVVAVDYGN